MTVVSKVILSFYVLATSCALIILKLGSKSGAPLEYSSGRLQLNINPYTIAGIMLYGFSFLSYMYLISKNDLGYIIPLTTAFVYVLIFLGSYFIFHEVFTTTKILGIALILSGLVFLNLKS